MSQTNKHKNKVKDSITIQLSEEKMLQLQGIASGFGVTPELIAQRWVLKQLESMEKPGEISHAMMEQRMMMAEEEEEE